MKPKDKDRAKFQRRRTFRLTPEKILNFHQEAERLETARLVAEREKEAERQRPVFRMR